MVGKEGVNAIRRVIMGILMVVFLGILMIWILTPTAYYKLNWLGTVRLKTTSTYFGAQGLI